MPEFSGMPANLLAVILPRFSMNAADTTGAPSANKRPENRRVPAKSLFLRNNLEQNYKFISSMLPLCHSRLKQLR